MTKTLTTLAGRLLLLVGVALAGCATTRGGDPRDPLEGYNRSVAAFNSTLDKALIKPAAKAYTKVIPKPVRRGVNNFFNNLGDVGVMVNNLLQGKADNAASDFGRLMMNSTFGLLGLIDVATELGIPKHNEDFGQTLGKWGVGSGPYLVLPLFGPTTLRDGVATVPDMYLNPLNYTAMSEGARWGVFGLSVINTRANLLEATNILEEAALDQYTFTRDAFLQRRLSLVHDGNIPAQLQPKYNDAEDLEDPEPDAPPRPGAPAPPAGTKP